MRLGKGKITDSLNLGWKRTNAISGDKVTEKFQFFYAKDAFAGIDDKAVLVQPGKKLAKVLLVLFRGWTGYEDVVNVREAVRKAAEYFIDKTLERLGGVPETKWHAQVLEESKRGGDGGLGDAIRMHGNLVIGFHQVDFGERGRSMKRCGEIVNMRYGIAVWNRDPIKRTVVPAWSPVTCALRNHMQGRCPTARRRSHNTELKHVLKLRAGYLEFLRSQATGSSEHRRASSLDVVENAMLDGLEVVGGRRQVGELFKNGGVR